MGLINKVDMVWLCCAVESFLVAERHVNDNKLFIH